MSGNLPADLTAVDDALVRLRRLWTASRSAVLDDLGGRVEMSSVLVVEGCAREAASGGEVTVGDVAAFLDVAHSTASRLVERAARGGLVRRSSSAVDARRAALVLTDAGRDLRARAVAARLGWLATVVGDWDEEEVRALALLLPRFADAVAAGQPEPAGIAAGSASSTPGTG